MGRRLPLLVLVTAVVVGLAARPATAAVTNDTRVDSQWGLLDIKAPEAWPRSKGGVKVAVVSSGIAKHPDLVSKTDSGIDATQDPPDTASDKSGRGTHLAGIVGAATNNGEGIAGVAPDARLIPIKAFESDSQVESGPYVKALLEVQKAKVPVVLVDLPEGYAPDPSVLQTLKNLGDAGVSVAVGGGGASLAGLPVLAVAATSQGGGQAGPGVGPGGVAAPGANIVSTTVAPIVLPGVDPYGYGDMSGSSQAAAHVAGALAILRGLGATAAQAADLLRTTARKSGNAGFGAGIIDVAAAVAAYKAPVPATTTTKPAATPTTKAGAGGGGGGGGGGTIPKAVTLPGGPAGTPLPGTEPLEPGAGEEAVVPPGAEDFLDLPGETGGPSSPVDQGDDRPLGLLAIGFGLLGGVGTGLSITFRRLADAPV